MDTNDECAVCCENIKSKPFSQLSGCCHHYHDDCIKELVKSGHKKCPTCRKTFELNNLLLSFILPINMFVRTQHQVKGLNKYTQVAKILDIETDYFEYYRTTLTVVAVNMLEDVIHFGTTNLDNTLNLRYSAIQDVRKEVVSYENQLLSSIRIKLRKIKDDFLGMNDMELLFNLDDTNSDLIFNKIKRELFKLQTYHYRHEVV